MGGTEGLARVSYMYYKPPLFRSCSDVCVFFFLSPPPEGELDLVPNRQGAIYSASTESPGPDWKFFLVVSSGTENGLLCEQLRTSGLMRSFGAIRSDTRELQPSALAPGWFKLAPVAF